MMWFVAHRIPALAGPIDGHTIPRLAGHLIAGTRRYPRSKYRPRTSARPRCPRARTRHTRTRARRCRTPTRASGRSADTARSAASRTPTRPGRRRVRPSNPSTRRTCPQARKAPDRPSRRTSPTAPMRDRSGPAPGCSSSPARSSASRSPYTSSSSGTQPRSPLRSRTRAPPWDMHRRRWAAPSDRANTLQAPPQRRLPPHCMLEACTARPRGMSCMDRRTPSPHKRRRLRPPRRRLRCRFRRSLLGRCRSRRCRIRIRGRQLL